MPRLSDNCANDRPATRPFELSRNRSSRVRLLGKVSCGQLFSRPDDLADYVQGVTASQPRGLVSVRNRYEWILDPRLGRFAVFVDGRKVGDVELGSQADFELPIGTHCIEVGLRWYRSPRQEFEILPGSHTVLDADIDRSLGVGARMARMLLHPRLALVLTVSGEASHRSASDMITERTSTGSGVRVDAASAGMARRRLLGSGILSGLGFTLIAAGAAFSPALIVVGAVFAAAGLAIGLTLFRGAGRT